MITPHDPTLARAIRLLRGAQGTYNDYRHAGRTARLVEVLRQHPRARLLRCADERTGMRFGWTRARRGRCVKIGHTSWSPTYTGKPYQLWAVW